MTRQVISLCSATGVRLGACLLALAALMCAPGGVSAQGGSARNTIESINVSSVQGGKVLFKVNFREALQSVPAGFTVTNPPRIAIDLPNTANGTGKSLLDISEGDVKSVNIVEASGRTRLVLNLTRTLNFTSALEDKTLVVTIEGVPVSATRPATQVTKFAEAAPGEVKQSLRDIDFRRGNNGEGRVIVDLASSSTGIDIRLQGRNIMVDFINTAVPRNLVRRLDVGDFGTPIRMVDTLDQGANTRMIVEPRGLWEYSAYQTDTQFILEVKPVKEDPNKLVQGTTPGYSGEKLSLNFQNVEVRAVLQVIADFTGLNIITSDTVGGSLTLRLKDVPWDQALDIILQSKGLSKRKSGNVVLIAPSDELATKEKLALEASQQISELESLRTESFVLSYAKADDVKKLLADKDQKILSKRGSAAIDARTNTLFVQDVSARLEDARRLISQLDVPVRQVMIEARVVVADDKFTRELGARFNFAAGTTVAGRNVGVGGTIDQAHRISTGIQPINADTPISVNLPVTSPAGQIGLNILNLGNSNLVELELSALETDNRGKIVSNPRVITSDKKKAIISQGTEIPYLTASSSGATTVSFKPAVLELAVTPQITPDDKIIMDLEVKKDSVGVIFANVPSIDTKKVTTQVLVENGDTVVLGGIFEQTIRNQVDKVPFLGDIPFIGALFRHTTKQDDKTELLIFITPRIIKDTLSVR